MMDLVIFSDIISIKEACSSTQGLLIIRATLRKVQNKRFDKRSL